MPPKYTTPTDSSNGHIARKRFGQNFLNDNNIIAKIIHAINPVKEDSILEIGPGQAALTAPLLEALQNIHVIEIDRDLIRDLHLTDAYAEHRLIIHEGDALKLNIRQIANEMNPKQPIRIVGNLPYNISTPLLFKFVDCLDRIKDAHFMLQREVVERMAASHNSKSYGRLSVMIQTHFQVEALFTVPPTAFNPPPKVQSQIVRLIPHPASPWPKQPSAHYTELVSKAFSARRKTLRKGLKDLVNEDGFAACGIDSGLRPENIDVASYIALSHHTLK
jgi:16S rRNA (adenine1518-N6/adenine1519-N6)-dimethyltransferase